MNDHGLSSSNNALSSQPSDVRCKSALSTSALGEDDDEPPSCSGVGRLPSQIITVGGAEQESTTIRTLPHQDTTATLDISEKRTSLSSAAPVWASKMDRLKTLFRPTIPIVGPPPTFLQSCMATLKYTPLNVCLIFIPVSWGLHYTNQSATLVFVFSALGIVPLAALLGFGTEQIAVHTSSSVGGLLNATLGNVTEMIITGIALNQCELEVIQSALLGGLLSNLLLVLGTAFLVGGYRFHEQEFRPMVAQLNSSLLMVSVTSLIIPVALHEYIGDRLEIGDLLKLSRGSAVILMLIYMAFMYFQFYTHNMWFLDRNADEPAAAMASCSTESLPMPVTSPTSSESPDQSECARSRHVKINTPFALGLLVAITALTYLTAEPLIGSLNEFTESNSGVSKKWVTLIIIPIIGNAAEHTTAIIVASKGKFDLAMSVAVGSSIQIALFVIPVLVLVAWGMNRPLTLLFDPVETLVLFLSVLLVKSCIEVGKSHWMSGVTLTGVYIIIALSFWDFPDTVRMIQGQPLVCS